MQRHSISSVKTFEVRRLCISLLFLGIPSALAAPVPKPVPKVDPYLYACPSTQTVRAAPVQAKYYYSKKDECEKSVELIKDSGAFLDGVEIELMEKLYTQRPDFKCKQATDGKKCDVNYWPEGSSPSVLGPNVSGVRQLPPLNSVTWKKPTACLEAKLNGDPIFYVIAEGSIDLDVSCIEKPEVGDADRNETDEIEEFVDQWLSQATPTQSEDLRN